MKLPVYIAGNGDALLMIHGIISDASFFDEIGSMLKEHFRVITYDRRGYGNADKPVDMDYSIEAQALDAIEVLKNNAVSSAWVVGNSAGAIIALEMAMKKPELVAGLILIEPTIPYDFASKKSMSDWNSELNVYVENGTIRKALPAFARVIEGEKETVLANRNILNNQQKKMNMHDMKKTYYNLENFMYGELNEVQRYNPPFDVLKRMQIPLKIFVTSFSENCLFRRISEKCAENMGWDVVEIYGNHNALKDNPSSSSEIIKQSIIGMKNGNEKLEI